MVPGTDESRPEVRVPVDGAGNPMKPLGKRGAYKGLQRSWILCRGQCETYKRSPSGRLPDYRKKCRYYIGRKKKQMGVCVKYSARQGCYSYEMIGDLMGLSKGLVQYYERSALKKLRRKGKKVLELYQQIKAMEYNKRSAWERQMERVYQGSSGRSQSNETELVKGSTDE